MTGEQRQEVRSRNQPVLLITSYFLLLSSYLEPKFYLYGAPYSCPAPGDLSRQNSIFMSLASPTLQIDHILLSQGKQLFRALNHPLRQKMIIMIHNEGRMTVTQLFTKMGLEQSVTSNHLAMLRTQKLLLTEKQQKFVFYSVNYGRLKSVQESIEKYMQQLTPGSYSKL